LLEAQLTRDAAELQREAESSAERQQWQRECNLRSLLAQLSY
jgi:hypothetical protein